jgi:hypothetical protein
MKRGLAYLFVAFIILLSIGGAGVLIWLTEVQHVPRGYVLGPLFLVIGVGFTALNLGVTDEYLRKHFGGDANADRMRDMWRGGWVGIVIGAGMIAAEYFL